MNKQLTLFTHSGSKHRVLSIEQLIDLLFPLPFVGTRDQYEAFLGILAILRPDSGIEFRYAGTSYDVPFGSLAWWVEYSEEY